MSSQVTLLSIVLLPPWGVYLMTGLGPKLCIATALTILGWVPGIAYGLYIYSISQKGVDEARIERTKRKYKIGKYAATVQGRAPVIPEVSVAPLSPVDGAVLERQERVSVQTETETVVEGGVSPMTVQAVPAVEPVTDVTPAETSTVAPVVDEVNAVEPVVETTAPSAAEPRKSSDLTKTPTVGSRASTAKPKPKSNGYFSIFKKPRSK